MKNTNILVTGGAGYIGSHIVELLVKEIFDIFKLLKKDAIVQYQKRRVGDIAQINADTKN